MSGYNAEISQPAEKDDEELKPYSAYELREALTLLEYDKARLLLTARHLVDESRKPIQADDYRLQHIWEQAVEIANDKGYCNVFDDFMDELGTGYAREIEVTAWVDISIKIPVPLSMPRNGDVNDYLETSWVQEAFDCQEIDLNNANWEVDWVENN